MRFKLLVAHFTYPTNSIDMRLAAWMYKQIPKWESDKRLEGYCVWQKNDTPVTMARNECLNIAEQGGFDLVLMLDSDNIPDLYLPHKAMNAKPFWDTAFDFWIQHNTEGCVDPKSGEKSYGPCVIAAPYCGPPPNECVYSFDWANFTSGKGEQDYALEMVPRHEAANRKGFHRAAALPTGVMLLDVRAVKNMAHPRFYYEWKDETQAQKSSTEDVAFTRDLTYPPNNIPIWCLWDSWAGHVKNMVVGKPINLPPTWVPRAMQKGAETNKALGIEPIFPKTDPVRRMNTYPKPPQSFPVRLIHQRDIRPEEDIVVDENPPAHLEQEMAAVCLNGAEHGSGRSG